MPKKKDIISSATRSVILTHQARKTTIAGAHPQNHHLQIACSKIYDTKNVNSPKAWKISGVRRALLEVREAQVQVSGRGGGDTEFKVNQQP